MRAECGTVCAGEVPGLNMHLYSHEHKFLTLFLMHRRLIDAYKRVRNLCSRL